MLKVLNNFFVEFDKCKHKILIDIDSLECEVSGCEHNMGEEIECIFSGEICCEKCNSSITFKINGYEYPVGAFNYSDYECEGGCFVDEPVLDVHYFEDKYDDNF